MLEVFFRVFWYSTTPLADPGWIKHQCSKCKQQSVVHGWSAHGGHGARRSFPPKILYRDFTRRQTRAQTLTRETFLSILRVKLFMCAQFLLIKDWLFEGKANLKCSYTTCTLIVLKRSFRKDDDAFKRSNKYVFFPASERCKYYVLRALQLFKHSLVTE